MALILSAQTPVQLATYLALTLYFFYVTLSINMTPYIRPYLSLIKSTNSALFTILAGLCESGR